MDELRNDLRYALRTLWKARGFALVALLSLALGIGANATIFTFVNALILNPLPFDEPSQLVAVYTQQDGAGRFLPLSHPNFESLREQTGEVFAGLAAYQIALLSLTGAGEPEQLLGQLVDGDYFPLLGVEGQVGRTLSPDDDRVPGGHPVVVLGHELWRRRFGGDPGIVGSTLTLSNQPFTVVGVAPLDFRGLDNLARPDFWVPASMHQQVTIEPFRSWYDDRRALLVSAVGRLAPGVTTARAQAALDAVARRLAEEFPDDNRGRTMTLLPLAESTLDPNLRGNLELAALILSGVVALVLLVACANVANLLLARAAARRREIAIRLAVGAGRGRLVRQLLTESLLLALAAGALGLAIAAWLRSLLWAVRPPLAANAVYPALDARVLGFTLLVAVTTGVLFGLAPALQSTRPEVLPALKNETTVARSAPRRRLGTRDFLVVAQLALSLLALLGAGLFVRGLRKAQSIDTGFDAEALAVFTVNVGPLGYDAPRGRQLFRQALERLGAAGLEAAVASNSPLNRFGGLQRTVFPEGSESAADEQGPLVLTNTVDRGYFETVGMRVLAGRGLSAADREDAPRVAIVNRAAAALLWGDRDPIGRRFRFFGDEVEHHVVGVTEDVKQLSLGEGAQPCIYLSFEQNFLPFMTFIVRAPGGPAAALAAARREVRALESNLPFIAARPLSEVVSESLWAPRMAASLLGGFGLLGLLLAAMGTYSVMSYYVSQRSHEIGIHLAVGARRGDVARLVLRRGMGLVLAGVVAGLVAGWLATRLVSTAISSLLYEVSAADAGSFLVTAALLLGIALLANLVPVRRATKVPPMVVMRGG